MDIREIKEMVAGEQYDFLRTNPHLGDRIVFLTLGGSHAYGTNVEGSDVDVRGCALNSRSDLLGLSSFDQVVEMATDTTIYSFNKLIGLLTKCNPNTIELLGCKPEHYFYMTDIGRELVENRRMFLSRAAVASFGGYATQQLYRLKNALARDRMPQEQAVEHIRGALERSVQAIDSIAFDNGGIALFTGPSKRDGLNTEVFCNIHLDGYPARDFQNLMNHLSSVLRNYEKLNHRNNKKDSAHLNKHAMHLIRLYLMCLDILEREEIQTYRENEREFLLSIRNGAFMHEDGTYRPEFFEMVNDFEKRMKYAKENTSLPKGPNMKMIEEFMMSVNASALGERFVWRRDVDGLLSEANQASLACQGRSKMEEGRSVESPEATI